MARLSEMQPGAGIGISLPLLEPSSPELVVDKLRIQA
jgi:hypothetical protein